MNACRILCFLTLLLASSTSFGDSRCPGDITPVRYHPLNDSQFTVPVMINGAGPYPFIVDTGAQFTAIDSALAGQLQLEYFGYLGVRSLMHNSKVDIATARTIQTGPYAVRAALVSLEKMDQIREFFPAVRGVLGQTFLSHFDVLIDRTHKLLCLDSTGQLQADIQGERLPMLSVASKDDLPFSQPVLISASVSGTEPGKSVLRLDSGSNVALLYADHLPATPRIRMQHANRCADLGRTALCLMITEARDVRLGRQTLRGVEFSTLVNDGGSAIAGEDGALPTGLFKDVFISHSEGYVIFNSRRTPRH